MAASLFLALSGCVTLTETQSGDGPISEADRRCFAAAPFGLEDTPSHSPQLASCIRTFIGVEGRTLDPTRVASLPAHGFNCGGDGAGSGQICVFSFATVRTLSNPLGSGGSVERMQYRLAVGLNGTHVTLLRIAETLSTRYERDPSQDSLLQLESGNLVDD